MKNPKTKPARGSLTVLRQICNLIPSFLTGKLARECGVEAKARSFSPWSHTVALVYAQLTHAVSLNDVCDGLALHSGPLSALRGATAPSRNGFSHANRQRNALMAEKLFWAVLEHLGRLSPGFGHGTGRRSSGAPRLARRFRRTISIIDATVLELVANCMDWASHRRRKAAAKCHLRLDLQSFLPRFAVVDTAREMEVSRARELCAGLCAGEIVVMDRGYLDYRHLGELHARGVFWVIRAKDNLCCRVVKILAPAKGRILRDEQIVLTNQNTSRYAPPGLRRVEALVEVDGQEVRMTFLTNHLGWAASSVAELYRCRWQIEVFFKQIKQTLQLADFLGHNANAVRWQLWTALLTYLLLRFLAHLSTWHHSFIRLWAVIRSALWQRREVTALLQAYGTAKGHFRCLAQPQQTFLPSFR